MNLSAEQLQLAMLIDAHVNQYPDTELGNEQLLQTTYDYMDAFKRVMDSSTRVQMDHLGQQYAGFYRFGKLLEAIAQGVADGVIDVPKDH
jgi:hypothetical protein